MQAFQQSLQMVNTIMGTPHRIKSMLHAQFACILPPTKFFRLHLKTASAHVVRVIVEFDAWVIEHVPILCCLLMIFVVIDLLVVSNAQ